MEDKLQEFKGMLLDEDYPLGLDEILGQIEYLFEDDKDAKDISRILSNYVDDYYEMWSCAEKFNKIKDLINEEG